MSVEYLFDYKPLEIFWMLMPVFWAIAIFEILAIYFFKIGDHVPLVAYPICSEL